MACLSARMDGPQGRPVLLAREKKKGSCFSGHHNAAYTISEKLISMTLSSAARLMNVVLRRSSLQQEGDEGRRHLISFHMY